MAELNKIRVRSSFSFATGTSRYRYPRIPDSKFLYLFDGDEHVLTPGEDFGTIPAFRVRLHRMTKARGLRYATLTLPATTETPTRLCVVIYRNQVGDLFEETYPGEPFNPEGAVPEPWPGQ